MPLKKPRKLSSHAVRTEASCACTCQRSVSGCWSLQSMRQLALSNCTTVRARPAWLALKPATLSLIARSDEKLVGAKAPPDALAGAPTSYGDVPKLGLPLPGDLGRPILAGVGNRVGHVQGGLLMSTALATATAAVPHHPVLTAASAAVALRMPRVKI